MIPRTAIRFGIPYYWVIAPDKDATFRPIFTTEGGTVLGGQYRQRFGNGDLTTDDSVTFGSKSQDPRTAGRATPTGSAAISPAPASGIYRRAGAPGSRASRRPIRPICSAITSPIRPISSPTTLYVEHFGEASYGNISAYAYQNLNPRISIASEPFVLPQAYYTLTTPPDVLGGRWQFNGDMLNLAKRDRAQHAARVVGSHGAALRRPDRRSLQVQRDRCAATATTPISARPTASRPRAETKVKGRVFPQAALNWRYPWIDDMGNISALVEPIVAAFAAPVGGNPAPSPTRMRRASNSTTPISSSPIAGPAMTASMAASASITACMPACSIRVAGSTQFLIGESYRFQSNTQFPVGTGLDHRRSDVVGRVTVAPSGYFNLFYRARLDSQDLAMRRQEVGAYGGVANLNGSISYIATSPIPGQPTVLPASQISLGVNFALTDRWSGQMTQTQNLNQGATSLNSAVHLTYRDDCLAVTGPSAQRHFGRRREAGRVLRRDLRFPRSRRRVGLALRLP